MKYRRRAGFKSQMSLAEAIGTGQTTISRIERHEIPISSKNEFALSEVFGLPDPALLYSDPDKTDLNALAIGLPDWEIEDIAAIIEMRRKRHLENGG